MAEQPRVPKFDRGHKVVVGMDIFNDGGFPDRADDELLVTEGSLGEVVQVGLHTETQTPIYMVEFDQGMVVGCLEEELSLLAGSTGPVPGALVAIEPD